MSVNRVSSTDGSLTPIATNTSNSLSYLSDVDIISPSTGQILQYDGSEWSNSQPAYQINDTNEATLADDDKFPFYDTSATAKRSSTWSNIKAKLKTYFDSIYSTIARADAQEELLEDTVGWTGKNRLKSLAYTTSGNGLTFTAYSDGSFLVNGTATDNTYYQILKKPDALNYELPLGNYIISSGCEGASANTYYLYIAIRDAADTQWEIDYTEMNGGLFTRTNNNKYSANFFIKNGVTVNNLLVKPMVRDANIIDDTFVPYHASVEEYCASKQLLEDMVGWLPINLNPYPYYAGNSATSYGITYTVDKDGVVSCSNDTSTGASTYNIHLRTEEKNSLYLPKGTYKLSGCPSGGSSDSFFLRIVKTVNNAAETIATEYGEGVEFSLTGDEGRLGLYIRVANGTSASGLVFKPMITTSDKPNSDYAHFIPYHASVDSCKVGWDVAGKSVKKNIFNLKEAVISVSNYTTLANTETGVELSNTGSYTYRGASFVFEGNDYWKNKTLTISSEVTVTSGAGRIGIGYSDDGSTYTDIFNDNVSSGKYEKTFSAGNHKYYRLILQCTLGTAAAGDVVYNELMIRDSRITDSTYAPFIYDNTELLSYADNGVLGAKNFLNNNAVSTTLNDGTWTVNSDKSITVSGTPTGTSYVRMSNNKVPKGEYILSGILANVSNVVWESITLIKNSNTIKTYSIESANDYEFDTTGYDYDTLTVTVKRKNNNVAISGTIYPMIRLATDTDSTYCEFAQTNRQLTVNKAETSVISEYVEDGATCKNPNGYSVGQHFQRGGKFCTAKAAIAYGATFTLNTNYVEGSVANSIEDLYSNIGLKSTPVSAIVANNLPILKRDITSIFYGSSLRSEIAEGNFKNVRVGDYIVGQSTGSIYYVAECDGWLGRGDTEMQTHHLRLMLFKAAGITQLWAGYRWSGDTGHYSANDLNRCPWNAATDVDPTSATASGSNNTNITRTYSGASVSAYMGSFIRDRLDNRLLPNCFEADFGSANVLQYKNWLGNSYSADIVSGAISTWTGGTSNAAWYARKLDLPSEVELYGSRICSSSFYDVGTQCEQLALFKQAKINDFFPRMEIWTKAVSSSSLASSRNAYGIAYGSIASNARWACPLACVS